MREMLRMAGRWESVDTFFPGARDFADTCRSWVGAHGAENVIFLEAEAHPVRVRYALARGSNIFRATRAHAPLRAINRPREVIPRGHWSVKQVTERVAACHPRKVCHFFNLFHFGGLWPFQCIGYAGCFIGQR